jgi:TolA-binding protein
MEGNSMIKRIMPVSLYSASFVLLIGLFASSATICLAEEAQLYLARMNVCSLIEAGNYADASSATNNMIADFSGNQGLPEAQYWIAERYERYDKFGEADRLYQQVIQNYFDSLWAGKSKLGISRVKIKSLVVSQNFDQAQKEIDKLAVDFASNSDLPEAIFWITERFQRSGRLEEAKLNFLRIIRNYPDSPWADKAKLWLSKITIQSLVSTQQFSQPEDAIGKFVADFAENPDLPEALFWISEGFQRIDRFEEAKQNFQRIIDNYPASPWAGNAKFWVSRVTVFSLIISQDYEGAKSALDKFMADYAGDTDYPETLYWIAERYERLGRFDEANLIYTQLSQKFPINPWTDKAKLGISRANVMALIVSEKYDPAKDALNKLIADFSSNPRLPGTLYWIAERYQRQSKFDEANRIYKQIAENYSGNPYTDKAQLDIRGTDILILLATGDANGAGPLLDKFIADFKQHFYAGDCLNQVAERCYYTAEQNQPGQANYYYAEAESIWQRIINNFMGNLDKAYYRAAVCRRQQGNMRGAIEYFQVIVNTYTNSEYINKAQMGIGLCYESLKDSNAIPAGELDNSLEKSYKDILSSSPDNSQIADILLKLGWLTFRQGRVEEAISYFENAFIILPECCKPNDALYAVGRYYQKTGQNEKAVKVYETLLKSLPESDPQMEKVKQNLFQIAETTNQ